VINLSHTQNASFVSWGSMLRRRWWLILIVTVLTVVAAALVSSRQERLYLAGAEVYLNPTQQLTGGAGQAAADAQARYLQTAASLAHTPSVAAAALRSEHISDRTPAALLAQTHVSADAASDILSFTVTDHRPRVAVALVNVWPGMMVRSSRSARSFNPSASSSDAAMGFSTNTCFPAASDAVASR
jgi:capsular polysaccharide biosynthesis protein